MVSVKKYMQAYVNVMPQRIKLLKQLLKRKKDLDYIIQRGAANDSTIENWKQIIGTGKLFVTAENRPQPTIRHLLWKIQKSLAYFPRVERKLAKLDDIDRSIKNAYYAVLEALGNGRKYRQIIIALDASVRRQEKNIKNINIFNSEIKQQGELIKGLKNVNVTLVSLQKTLKGVLTRIKSVDTINYIDKQGGWMQIGFYLSFGGGIAIIVLSLMNVVAQGFGFGQITGGALPGGAGIIVGTALTLLMYSFTKFLAAAESKEVWGFFKEAI